MTGVESREQYSNRDDSSRISKVEPREYSSLQILEVFYFRRDGVMNLLVAGTAKDDINPLYLESSTHLLESVSKMEDVHLVFGGYHRGIMAIAYDEFKKNSKKVIAVSDTIFQDYLKELDVDTAIVTKDTIERFQKLYENSDCILFLPGGVGTFSELFSAIEENKNSSHPKKIILYNHHYFFTPMLKELYHLYQNGFIDDVPASYMIIESEEEKVIELIEEMK